MGWTRRMSAIGVIATVAVFACSVAVLPASASTGDTATPPQGGSLTGSTVSLIVPGLSATCTVYQQGHGLVTVYTNANVQEESLNNSWSTCGSFLTRLVTFAEVENLNPVYYRAASNSKTGSGDGPVSVVASTNVPATFYGPSLRFTWTTNAYFSNGTSLRICQQTTTNVALEATSYTASC